MKFKPTCLFTFLGLFALNFFGGHTIGQTCIGLGGSNPILYTQDFNILGQFPAPRTPDAANIVQLSASPLRFLGKFDNAFNDNNVLLNVPGIALVEEGTNSSSVSGRYGVTDGSTANVNTYSFGTAATSERAFGSLTEADHNLNWVGACFTNTTSSTASAVRIVYTGEMWRRGGSLLGDRLDFQYAVGATNLHQGTYVNFDALDFITPNLLAPNNSAVDGNAAANRTVFPPTIIAVSVPVGGTIHIRWQDSDIAGVSDDGLSIDDLSFRFLSTTAAATSISGRVATADGRGIRNIQVRLTGADGEVRTATTSSFGYYRFEDVQSGQTYTVSVSGKRYQFEPNTRVISLSEEATDFDFVSIN